jgi:polysaccharide biosynthesis transport protein
MNVQTEETSALKLYGQIFWRRRLSFLLTAGAVLAYTIGTTLTQPKSYESSFLMLVNNKPTQRVIAESTEDQPDEQIETAVQVLRTVPIIADAVKPLSDRYPNLEAESISNSLKIQQLGKSGIISVSLRDQNPKRLTDLLSQLGQTYVQFSLTSRKSRVTSAVQFIERTLPDAKQNLVNRSLQLEDFRMRNHLIDPQLVGSSMSKSLSDLEDKERTVEVALAESKTLYNNLLQRAQLQPSQALETVSLNQDIYYQDLLKQFQEAENKLALEQLRFTDSTPQIQALQERRDRIKRLLADQVLQVLGKNSAAANTRRLGSLQISQITQLLDAENNFKIEQARLAALQTAYGQMQKQFILIPELQRQYDDLSQQVKIASDSVSHLLTKLEEFRIIEAQESAPWQIIQSPSTVGRPVSPSLSLNLLLGSVVAVLAGGFVIYLREQFDNSLHSYRDLKEILNLPRLAMLPKIDARILSENSYKSSVLPRQWEPNLQFQQSSFYEALQYCLFCLRYTSADKRLKTIGLTSSTSQEGKSTIARHLSIVAAGWGYRVLLIDGDLRKPELHLALEVSNETGLSSILATNVPWQEVVQDTEQAGFKVLTAGPIPPNPAALLGSQKMGQLINQLRENFDLIFVDLPPAVGLTDPLEVSAHLDALVLVAGLNKATRESLRSGMESLGRARCPLVGFICNMSSGTDMPNSTYLLNPKDSNMRVQQPVGIVANLLRSRK